MKGRGACGRARGGRRRNRRGAPGRLRGGGGAPGVRNAPPGQAPGPAGAPAQGATAARLGSARLGSARLGSARLGSARLGSARLGSALNYSGRASRRCQALVRHTGNVLPAAPCEGGSARPAPPRSTKHRLRDGAAASLVSRHPHRPVLLLDADSRTRHAPAFLVRAEGSSISLAQSWTQTTADCNTVAASPMPCCGGRPISCLKYSFSAR